MAAQTKNVPDDLASRASASQLCRFVDASPSPFHVCATVASTLDADGFTRLAERDTWPSTPGRYYVVRGGSLVAWSTESADGPASPFRVVGGHTDSPNLRVKQHPDLSRAGWQLVGLEPYGGAWLNSWLDRDLGLSGRVSVRDGRTSDEVLLNVGRPILRVPQLAIHLASDRKGVELDPQRHVDAVWGVGTSASSVRAFVAAELGVAESDVLGWELMAHDVAPSSLVGRDGDLVSAARLDNQCTCFAGLHALLSAAASPARDTVPVLALFDHEEVGSMSDRGAHSDLLATTLERIVLAAGGARNEFLRAVAGSVCASGDMAHATHPNYADRHEPEHRIEVGGGPVLKVNQNLRYASDAAGAAAYALACDQAGVSMQRYVHRADLPCGSTIGPITASRTGLSTVDVGAAQLAMHSARELMAAADVPTYAASLAAFLAPQR
ncbi:M18 family aminopeptidase [Solicola gregarius]|uniref:Probable M18 family aminopeptidase 2 n=1 Tax=Solicola gregarius TaxID=2908642 RepID=A0AA46TH75_9ACTN|nr:M18 family aminopeptidase [Solicola gregarius]UYM05302.1 M18 family aminopeptidase [Solicola gregarius]